MKVAEEQHAITFLTFALFDEFTIALHSPQCKQHIRFRVATMLNTHDSAHGQGCFLGMVVWYRAHSMVEDMSLDDSVKEMTADETEVTVSSCHDATRKGPDAVCVMG